MYLVPYMPSAAHALGALCHTCSCASFLTCSRASRVLHVFVPHETYTLPVLGMLVPGVLPALVLLVTLLLQVFQA